MEKFVFEEAMARIEEIADRLDEGNLPLEQSITLYEEGSRLALQCEKALQNAQQRITELSKNESGENNNA